MSIEAQIEEAFDRALVAGVHSPTRLYLGQMESIRLNLLTTLYPMLIQDNSHLLRRKFRGLEVFVVDAPMHLEVGP